MSDFRVNTFFPSNVSKTFLNNARSLYLKRSILSALKWDDITGAFRWASKISNVITSYYFNYYTKVGELLKISLRS